MKFKLFLIFFILLVMAGCTQIQRPSNFQSDPSLNEPQLTNLMQLISPVFGNNQFIPTKYTCDGEDINPPLEISQVPVGAQSLALIVDDPDAPAGDWVHWILWNIPPTTQQVEEASVPAGAVQGLTDFGRASWGGPCPPSGTHRYQFKLYALDSQLNLPPSTRKNGLEQAMQGHILDQAVLIGLYQGQ